MADVTHRKLLELAADGNDLQTRQAALLVLGELGDAKNQQSVQVLCAALEEKEESLRRVAIEALGKLKAESSLPRLIEFVRQGGTEVEAAARAAGAMGAKGTKAVEKLLHEVHPFQRRRIASSLALGGTHSAVVAAAHALQDDDPTVVDAAARSLATEVPGWSTAQKRALAEELISQLQPKRKPPLSHATEAAMVRVLATLHAPSAEDLFWQRLDAAKPKPVRLTALQALGGFDAPAKERHVALLMTCAADRDFQVAAPALMLLQKVNVGKKDVAAWQTLLHAPDPSTRRLAVDKLASIDDGNVATALLEQLHHPDRGLRDAALAALKRGKAGKKALEDALLTAATPDQAWSLARAQLDLARDWKAAQRQKVFAQFAKHHDAEDRRAEALFFLLRETDHDGTRDLISDRAATLAKKKKYAEAVSYYRLLARDPACGEETRFDLAATGLKLSAKDLAPEARHADPCLQQFARLLQDPAFDVATRVTKAKWLDAADLYYLGFHFVEQNHRERDFGAAILQAVIKRSPTSALAKDAKRKLKSQDLL